MTATKQILSAATAVAVLSVGVELGVEHTAHGAWWHAIAGFDLVIGFVGCFALVWGSKVLGLGLQRPEHEHPEDEP